MPSGELIAGDRKNKYYLFSALRELTIETDIPSWEIDSINYFFSLPFIVMKRGLLLPQMALGHLVPSALTVTQMRKKVSSQQQGRPPQPPQERPLQRQSKLKLSQLKSILKRLRLRSRRKTMTQDLRGMEVMG